MDLNDIKVDIIKSIGIPIQYRTEMFEIEKETFENVFQRCPRTIEEFDTRYSNKEVHCLICTYKKKIIAFRIYEKINHEQVQSMFMVVHKNCRGLKISNLICSLSVEYFKWLDFKYITSWTHIDITASKILAKYAPYISVADDLTPIEQELLNNYESYYGKENGFYGRKRTVPNYYNMRNSKKGDANFWVHHI